jgi:hypothetical protein
MKNQFEPIIGRFDNGGMIVAWTEYSVSSTYNDSNLYIIILIMIGTLGGSVSEVMFFVIYSMIRVLLN